MNAGKERRARRDALHARIDGHLPPERAAAVDIYLAEHPEEQRRWSDYAAQRQDLREALAIPPGEPIPEHLRVAAKRGKKKPAPPAGEPG
jgi:anti-sigma factor RsiW